MSHFETHTPPTWDAVRAEAEIIAQSDNFVKPIMEECILAHHSFGDALSFCLSKNFSSILPVDAWLELLRSVFNPEITYAKGLSTQITDSESNSDSPAKRNRIYATNNRICGPDLTLEELGMLDLVAINDRDFATEGLVSSFLYYKGFKALQAHRIAHVLWLNGRRDAALAVQSRCSEVFAVDIHPAAVIGEGLFIDHGTGIVIGETAIVGRNCSFLHGVTLGSTGKDTGDRHPKIGDDVLVGCLASILGNITVGDCCKIGSGSIVLKNLVAGATAVGNPARVVGRSMDKSSAHGMDVGLKNVITAQGHSYESTWAEMDFREEALFI